MNVREFKQMLSNYEDCEDVKVLMSSSDGFCEERPLHSITRGASQGNTLFICAESKRFETDTQMRVEMKHAYMQNLGNVPE